MGKLIDLTGKTFGRWKVLGRAEHDASGRVKWMCQCECGVIKPVMAQSLLNESSKSCGCYDADRKENSYEDLAGRRFGRLIALSINKSQHGKNGGAYWDCMCDCGNITTVPAASLKCGNTKSCGCLHAEVLASVDRTKISHAKHGAFDKYGRGERLYGVWKGMRARCYNRKHRAYQYYGERGIRVCDEWRTDYGAFREWAMKNGYNPLADHGECTLDRIDNDGNYTPMNCRFVSMAIQNTNKRKRGTAI